jgi:GNAT superfamily N-acetyltransferase
MQQVCQPRQIEVFMGNFADMYAKYLLDGEGAEVCTFEHGFMILKTMQNLLYIETIYVAPEMRKSGYGRQMLQMVEQRAIREQRSGILGSCSPNREGSTVSMKAMFACGFNLHSCDKDIIYLLKPLGQKEV